MKISKLLPFLLTGLLIVACNNDDDSTETEPLRDAEEVKLENNDSIVKYLESHYYNYAEFENPPVDFDYAIRFDTITEALQGQVTPLIDMVDTKVVEFEGVTYDLFYLVVREGVGPKTLLGQSVVVDWQGQLLDGDVFSETFSPRNLQTLSVNSLNGFEVVTGNGFVEGFTQLLLELGAGTGFTDNPDGTITWNQDYGIGAVFMPSGLGYFGTARSGIPAYSPLIFAIDLYELGDADQDLRVVNGANQVIPDGIPSHMEDVDGDGDPRNDDTDEDGVANFGDPDDDGDGVLTEFEYDEDGDGIPDDYNNDGIPNYLDKDYPKNVN